MAEKCEICNEKIEEKYGKLNGAVIKSRDENKRNQFIYVCPECQKKKDWINIAKIRGA